ncbi:hypothetical protein DERF_006088 [Dermatophagoides farinae]|uniref:Uncharacterized protein n=1 Tax=Dermatophagoides farinae TaxID=6954 RepID=A0A922L9C7_DERFA|nr:hypothetical protein DERF_006088 [Dermatophagoides farinae]
MFLSWIDQKYFIQNLWQQQQQQQRFFASIYEHSNASSSDYYYYNIKNLWGKNKKPVQYITNPQKSSPLR